MRLTDDQLASYERDGFLALAPLVAADALVSLRIAYDDVLEREVRTEGDRMLGGVTRQVMMPSAAHEVFASNAAVDAATEIARQVFNADAFRFFDMLIYKPPGHEHPTPWHQDMAYADMPVARAGQTIPLETIQFWMALDDADQENGCMHFVPAVHRNPLLDHVVASGAPEDPGRLLALAQPDRQLDLATAVAAPLRAGEATMHSYGTPHFTPPNRSSDRPRRAYIFNLVSDRGLRAMARRSA